jgi:hypothetical protein
MDAVGLLNLFQWSVGNALRGFHRDPVGVVMESESEFAPYKEEAKKCIDRFRASDISTIDPSYFGRCKHMFEPFSMTRGVPSSRICISIINPSANLIEKHPR